MGHDPGVIPDLNTFFDDRECADARVFSEFCSLMHECGGVNTGILNRGNIKEMRGPASLGSLGRSI